MNLLLTGPAGSGKSAAVLEALRQALREGRRDVRLLVPTATMARHTQNRLAREGFVFPGRLVETLFRFLDSHSDGPPQASEAVLYLVVEQAARRVSRPEFARVVELPGFCASLARTMAEFASAGCDAARLEAHLPDAPLGEAFLAVYRQVERELDRRGLALRARRLETLAARIGSEGLPGTAEVWLDGFHALPDPELDVIGAMARHAAVTVTLVEGAHTEPVRARLLEMGFAERRLARRRPWVPVRVVKAPGIEREAAEIARRILEETAGGRPFREIGVVVRQPAEYVPVLRAAFTRFGIPACFYFDGNLDEHPVARLLAGAVDAMLGGWEHAATLRVLRLAPRLAGSAMMDGFDFAVREQLPNAGLGALKALAEERDRNGVLLALLGRLESLEWLLPLEMAPRDWAAHLKTLRRLFRPARPPEEARHEDALAWRLQAAALDAFDGALDAAAEALAEGPPMKLADFWRVAESVLRLTPLRVDDGRRNVVQVLSAHEARQWSLPLVFVCGMVEKQFPAAPSPDAFFPEAARASLNASGIRVRTAAALELEERALFDAATTGAGEAVTLTWPEYNERGDRNLPSIYLDDILAVHETARAVRLRAGEPPAAPAALAIAAPDLLEWLAARTARVAPTALEQFLQCPFEYFSSRTLKLQEPPARPEERLDDLVQGSIVHAVLQEWVTQEQPLEPLFNRIFDEHCEAAQVPAGWRRERTRDRLLADLRTFTEDTRWPRGEFQSRTEIEFEMDALHGKIDRLDVDGNGRAFVIDYKYSGAARLRERVKDQNLLQAPIYLLAAQRVFGWQPAGVFYVGLRGGVTYVGWAASDAPAKAQPLEPGWMEASHARALEAIGRIRAGRIEAAPADPEHCVYCLYADVCRYAGAAAAAAAAGEEA